MFCDKCGGRCHIEEEFTRIGSVFAPACFNCGWRGAIIKDNRVLLNKEEVREMPCKKGDCVGDGCNKKNIALMAKGLCWSCYSKIPHKSIKPRDPQRSNSPVKHIPVFVSDGKTAEVINTSQSNFEKFTGKEPINNLSDREGLITLNFNTGDLDLFRILIEKAQLNRRSIENEIFYALDKHLLGYTG